MNHEAAIPQFSLRMSATVAIVNDSLLLYSIVPAKCVGRNFIHYELCCPCGTYGVYLRSWQV